MAPANDDEIKELALNLGCAMMIETDSQVTEMVVPDP